MAKHYLILSAGAYSDYSPTYFVGDREITQEEYKKKGEELGDIVIEQWENAPTRPHVCNGEYCCWKSDKDLYEKYNPVTGERYYSSPNSGEWFKLVREWILAQGYEELPENIPELNSSYSEFPNTKVGY